jgi:hypothetical protein
MLRAMRFLWVALLAIACGSPSQVGDGLPQTCDPLRVAGACMMPWPNAIYLKTDSTTQTGFRVALSPETLPARANGDAFDPTRWNTADGFSPAGPILYWFAEPIDASSLVPETNISASLDVGAATVIVDMATNELVAHFSGIDENVHRDGDRQAIIITPAQRLLPKHRYAVAITKFIKTTSGDLPTRPPLFDRIASGDPPDGDALAKAEAARMPDILASLKTAGVKRDDLIVAWDFVTGSDEQLTGHVLSMRDQALAAIGPTGFGYTITSVEDDFDTPTFRRIRGTFTAPAFLDNEDESMPEAQLSFDAQGKPIMNGMYEAPFTILVPRVALARPLPILLVGHGLFNTGEIELGDQAGSDIQDLANGNGYVVVATDWIGLSAHENPLTQGSNNALADMLSDFSRLPEVTDRLQQALVTTMVLVRTMTGRIVNDASLIGLVDATKVYYYGNSLGGIMGLSFMGYDPAVTLGALGVGGGFWSTLFQRSVNWKEALLVFPAQYPDSLDQQLLMALAQMQFDFSDPATVAPYVLSAPLEGTPKKQVVMMMGVGDAQVPNIATEMIARTSGITLLSPNAVSVFGMSPLPGPLASALTTWNVNSPPAPPDTNMTPAHDNQVHQAVRRLAREEEMIGTFFSTGQIVDTCGGPCNLPVPAGTPPPDI